MSQLILWWAVFFGAMFFIFALKTQSTTGYVFYTLSFAVCTATAVVLTN